MKVIVFTAVRYPKYTKEVHENASEWELCGIEERIRKDMEEHRIEDYQIVIYA